MKLKRPNKALEQKIQQVVKGMMCPVHNKPAKITMESENEEVVIEACCPFFKKDVMVVGERMRKDFLYKDEKTRERLERERKKNL
ncbi:hypothetical protein CNR22_01325 [Sphingobacteriaceae bacterium]|nr:hypothetical protein CNR22_01325 [Sphingobacteriaceae bacterium]